MDRRIYLLMLVTFVVGTVELVIAGLLNLIATDLHVSEAAVGQLITVYSLVFALGSPLLIALTAHIERRRLLLTSLAAFFVACLIAVLSPNFTVLLLSRVLLALSCSLIVILSLTLATRLMPDQMRGRAIGLIFMGISGSLVLGVPLGTLVGEVWGWRATFGLIAVLTLLSGLAVARLMPTVPGREVPKPLGVQLRTLREPKVLSAQLISLFQMTGQFTLYAYITPFLQQRLQLSLGTVTLVLTVYGLAGLAGGWLGGWSADRFGHRRSVLTWLALHAAALLVLPLATSTSSLALALPVIVVWCAANMAPSPGIQSYLMTSSPESADVQVGLNTSALHLGVAAGSALGGVVIASSPVASNAWVGGGVIVLALGCAWFSFQSRLRRPQVHSAAD